MSEQVICPYTDKVYHIGEKNNSYLYCADCMIYRDRTNIMLQRIIDTQKRIINTQKDMKKKIDDIYIMV